MPEAERPPPIRSLTGIAGRLCDLAVPGMGMLLVGRSVTGWGALGLWVLVVLSIAASVCLLGFHPLLALLGLVILYGAFEILLALEPLGSGELRFAPGSALKGAVVFAVVLVATPLLVMGRWCTPVVVGDLCGYPGLLPGEIVLVEKVDFTASPPGAGDLVAARLAKGIMIGRVAATGGDRIGLSGPSVVLNGAMVESEDLGRVKMPVDEDPFPEESRSLRAYREELGGNIHPFFFSKGVLLTPTSFEVPEGQIFLLCDNRSTARSTDSRTIGAFPLEALIGRPGRILWSRRPKGSVRFDRIGSVWK